LPESGMSFDPLPVKVTAARTLAGAPVVFSQNDKELMVKVAKSDQNSPVTVVELTLDQPLVVDHIIGSARLEENLAAEYGTILSGGAKLTLSSSGPQDQVADHARLFSGPKPATGFAFHTGDETHPWAEVDLGAVKNVKTVSIVNSPEERRTRGLMLSVSEDGKTWEKVWSAPKWEQDWLVPITRFHAGIDVPGRLVRYLKIELPDNQPRPLLLQRFTVFGEE
jgi:F5/8 type C domain